MRAHWAWRLLHGLSGALVIASMLLPWWDESRPLSLHVESPKVALLGGVFMVAAAVAARSENQWFRAPPLAATALVGFSLVLFYFGVVDTLFADLPFTHHVRIGFFLALLGFGWGAVTGAAIVISEEESSDYRLLFGGVGVGFLTLVALAVWRLYSWTANT